MADRIVQLQDKDDNNLYPIAGGTGTGMVTKAMLQDDVAIVSQDLSTPSSIDYVATANIKDGAVTSDKIDWATIEDGSFGSRITGNISLSATQFIAIGRLRIITVQTAPHNIAAGETILKLNDLADIPSSSLVVPGVVQATGASLSIVLYGRGASDQGELKVAAGDNIPTLANRVAFQCVWLV